MNNDLFIVIWIITIAIFLTYIFWQKRKYKELENKYKKDAITDELTSIYNRRYLLQRYKEELNRAKRIKKPLQVMFIDVDNLKNINDQFGHTKGDETIRRIARAIKANARNYDIYGRYGGDEFLLLLPNTSSKDAETLGKRLMGTVKEIQVGTRDMSISIGLCQFDGKNKHNPLEEADQAMYVLKKSPHEQGGIHIINPSKQAL